MTTEDALREALQREAARHRVNPALPKRTIYRARAARAAVMMTGVAMVAALGLGAAAAYDATRHDGGGRVSPAAGESPPPRVARSPLLLVTAEGWKSRASTNTATSTGR